MNILSSQNLSKSHGIKPLFSGLSFGIEDTDRAGLIGANGSGKSTLLKVLAGAEAPDTGQVTVRQGIRVEYAPQNPQFDPAHTVIDHIFATQTALASAVREYESLCRQLEKAPSPEIESRLARAMAQIDAAQGWEYESRARAVLSKLGVHDLDAQMGTLSGGYRKRVALARALLADADLLILDEPTNHLDADTIAWLEDYLNRMSGALLLVTHDRYFLDRVTRRIIELDQSRLFSYDGNFSYYLEKKAEHEQAEARLDERRRSILRKELEWLNRGARARRTHEKHRIERVRDLQATAPTRRADALQFESAGQRIGSKIVELDSVSKAFGPRQIISKFTYTVAPGERLGIVGPNGAGKSTLVNILTGRLVPDSGTVDIGTTVQFGVFDQESAALDPEERAIDYVKRDGGDNLRGADGAVLSAERMMERFHFTSQMLFQPIEKLSGGERRRLHLVRTLMKNPNFLVLDEPTNDLDIPTLQALEDFLDGFPGCLLVVSHDRYFLDRTVQQLLSVEGDGMVRLYPGGYDIYERMRAEREAEEAAQTAAAAEKADRKAARASDGSATEKAAVQTSAAGISEPKKKLSYKEQREFAEIEDHMPKWEARLADLEQQLANPSSDYMELQKLTAEQSALQQKLDLAMERWLELSERA